MIHTLRNSRKTHYSPSSENSSSGPTDQPRYGSDRYGLVCAPTLECSWRAFDPLPRQRTASSEPAWSWPFARTWSLCRSSWRSSLLAARSGFNLYLNYPLPTFLLSPLTQCAHQRTHIHEKHSFTRSRLLPMPVVTDEISGLVLWQRTELWFLASEIPASKPQQLAAPLANPSVLLLRVAICPRVRGRGHFYGREPIVGGPIIGS